jgi:hypothetical protein
MPIMPLISEYSAKQPQLTNNNNTVINFANKTISLSLDDSTILLKKNLLFLMYNFDFNYKFLTTSFHAPKVLTEVASFFTDLVEDFSFTYALNSKHDYMKSSLLLNVRKPLRNLSITYNAIHKVFRTRFDENRAHVNVNNFTLSKPEIPFIADKKILFEKAISKTKISYMSYNYYKNNILPLSNLLSQSYNSLNYYYYEFPL